MKMLRSQDIAASPAEVLCRIGMVIVLILSFSQTCFSTPLSYSQVGSFLWRGREFLAPRGDSLFCATSFGIELWDFSDPASPDVVERVPLDFKPTRVAVAGDYVAAVSADGRLALIQSTKGQKMRIVDESEFTGHLVDLGICERNLLVLSDEVLELFTINDAHRLQKAVSHPTTEGHAVALNSSSAYLVRNSQIGSLEILSLQNQLQSLGVINWQLPVSDIDIRNDTAFISGAGSDLEIWNLSDPENPLMVSNLNCPSNAIEVSVSGDFLALGFQYHSMRIVDIHDPLHPSWKAIIDLTGQRKCMSAVDRAVFIVDDRRFRRLDFTNLASPYWQFDSAEPGKAEWGTNLGLAVIDSLLVVARGADGVKVVDDWQSPSPKIVRDWTSPQCNSYDCGAVSISVTPNLIVTQYSAPLKSFQNIVDAQSLEFITELQWPWVGSLDRSINGDTVVMSMGSGEVAVVDFSNPFTPVKLNQICGSGRRILFSSEALAAIKASNEKALELWDISNVGSAVQTSSYDGFTPICFWESPPHDPNYYWICYDTGPNHASADGNTLAATNMSDGLTFFDISDQHNIVSASVIGGYSGKVVARGGWVYSPKWTSLDVYYAADPYQPVHTLTLDCRADISDFVLIDDYLVVSTSAGVVVFKEEQATDVESPDLDMPVSFQLDQNYPNPFNNSTLISFQMIRSAWVKIDVLDILGRKIATLHDGKLDSGSHEVEWNGRDGEGQAIASGVYFYRLKAGDYQASRKMVLLK